MMTTSALASSALASLLALALPVAAAAQAAPDAPRAYVGLALYSSEYQPLRFSAMWSQTQALPLQLTLGYQLGARWAVQGSAAYSSSETGYYRSTTYSGPVSSLFIPGEYMLFSTRHNLSVAVLGRYTLTRRPARRLQVDALLGMTLAKQYFKDVRYSSALYTGQYYVIGYTRTQATGVLATAGAGLRYRLVPHLEATFEGTANVDFRDNFSGFSNTLALGLRANIGRL